MNVTAFWLFRTKAPVSNATSCVCIDTLGLNPVHCDGRLEWHATIPMSASFVDRLGMSVLQSALRQHRPGYTLHFEPFVATSDTLIGDPKYGFPCPWITTHHKNTVQVLTLIILLLINGLCSAVKD